MKVLAIESSCDETAVAIVGRDSDGSPAIFAQNIASQIDVHQAYGGVVPEIAARAHLDCMDHLIGKTLRDANLQLSDMDAIAATAGPGLIGGLIVGMMTGKSLAMALNKPFLGINHLEGHALTARLTDNVDFPYLLLLVSGGHTQLIKVSGVGKYTRLATTIDDALGEAFDKTAKLLGIGHPGGPNVERQAFHGDPKRFEFPRPLRGKPTLNMSFSGLKTAVRQTAQENAPLSEQDIGDICASFQNAVADVIADRCRRAMEQDGNDGNANPTLVAAGGVAANKLLRSRLVDLCREKNWKFVAPPLKLCGDNAAMIGWAAIERLETALLPPEDIAARSRWPLDEDAAAIVGSGRRGTKV